MKKKVTKIPKPVTLDGKTKEQQKVIVAKDVIAHMKADIYRAHTGSYITDIIDDEYTSLKWEDGTKDLNVKDNWERIAHCKVCGVGACLMSITKFKNELSFKDLPGNIQRFEDKHIKLLKSVFTPKELIMIEVAFEGYYNESSDNIGRDIMKGKLTDTERLKCMNLYSTHASSNNRLIAIMQNIITNKGVIKF